MGDKKGERYSMDVDLGVLEPSDFPEVYDIMEESFPASEVRPYEKARELIDHPDYNILAVKSPKGKLGGFLAVWNFPTFNFAEYFAISKKLRGKGLGSAALKRFLKRNKKPLVLEVEAFNTTTAKRRVRFYERLGFVRNDITYIEPPTEEGETPIPLTIMSYPHPIPQEKRQEVKALIFKQVYGMSI